MLGKLAGIIPALTKQVTGVIQQRADQRQALEQAGYEARLAGWIDDAIIVTFLIPLWLGMASVFQLVEVERVREMVEIFNLLLSSDGAYGMLLQICLFVGLGVGVSRKFADRAVKKQMDRK